MSHDLTIERDFDASPDVVFAAFIDPAAQHALYADAPEWIVESACDLRVGGRWWISFGPPGGAPALETNVFEAVDRPHRLVYRSTMRMPGGSTIDTRLEVTFEAIGRQTRMRLVQHRFPTAEVRDDFYEGWNSILGQLARVVDAKAPA